MIEQDLGIDKLKLITKLMTQEELHDRNVQHEPTFFKKDAFKQDFDGADFYAKLHHVEEILWKQHALNRSDMKVSKNALLEMADGDFHDYYKEVIATHLSYWTVRQNRTHTILQVQAKTSASHRYRSSDLMTMSADCFGVVFKTVLDTFVHEGPTSEKVSVHGHAGPPSQDNCSANSAEQDFDSDGFRLSGGEDDDEDEEIIFFKGHGQN